MGVVIDRGFEKKILEVIKEDFGLSKKEEARLRWLSEQEVVIRCGNFEQGISKKQWREIR